MADKTDELREKIALKLSPHLSRFFKINPDVDDIAAERERALSIADEILAILPAQPDVSGLVGAVTDLLSVMDYGDEDPEFTDDEAVSYRSDKDGNPIDDPMTFGHIRRVRQALTLSATPESGWRDIECAPKDRTRVLLSWGGATVVGFYLDNSHTQTPWKGWRTLSGEPTPKGPIKAWMPLPDAPNTEGSE